MGFALLKKKADTKEFQFETQDLLVIFDNDKKTSTIEYVDNVDLNSVNVDGYRKVPIADCEITTGRNGRIFFYRAPSQSIEETQRLAELEQDIVLQHLTSYRPPQDPSSFDFTKMSYLIIIIAMVSVFGLTSCT